MNMYCEHCHRTFADDDMKWKKGYHDYSYRTYPVCPFCSSENIEEKEDGTEDEELSSDYRRRFPIIYHI